MGYDAFNEPAGISDGIIDTFWEVIMGRFAKDRLMPLYNRIWNEAVSKVSD